MTTKAPRLRRRGERIGTDENGQGYPRPVPVEEIDLVGVLCFVCLDEGCEWCPAVDAVEDDPHLAAPDSP